MYRTLADLSASQRAEAVAAFNARYGEMERALWSLSMHCRPDLASGDASPVVEALVWTLKSWWGVQGVRSETKPLMAKALVTAVDWSPALFASEFVADSRAEEFAYESVSALVSVSVSLGVGRREFSLASKVLHWLLPRRVPVYDSFVRQYLLVPGSWDHPQAYRQVVRDTFEMAREVAQDLSWAGTIEPITPLHALDKCLWWAGGGHIGTAALVKKPWQVLDRLGIERPKDR